MAQKKLMDDLIEIAKTFKRQVIVKKANNEPIKSIYTETIKKYKSGITNWLPSSHFYIEKAIENVLQTLELYYIVTKFNEGSSRKPGIKISYFGLNYGLCLENGIDYGKPDIRRSYDYWRQDEFDYTNLIPVSLNSVETPKCSNCGYEYTDKTELEIAQRFGYCLSCKKENSIQITNSVSQALEKQLEQWKNYSLPDIEINILRVLYNNQDIAMTAYEISLEVERHYLGLTKIMDKLKRLGYITYNSTDKRYYKIEEAAIIKFFS